MKKITQIEYTTRFPNGNEEYFNKLNQSERSVYLECLNYYYHSLIQYLNHKLDLIKYDDSLTNSKNGFIPVSEESMDIYQSISSDYFKYIYIRNNIYIERLTTEEIMTLRNFMKNKATISEPEFYSFVENTYAKIIDEFPNDTKKTNFGPENKEYFAASNSIIIGVRTDDFADLDKIENWIELYDKREFELDFFVNFLKSSTNGKLSIPISVIRYKDESVKKKLI